MGIGATCEIKVYYVILGDCNLQIALLNSKFIPFLATPQLT